MASTASLFTAEVLPAVIEAVPPTAPGCMTPGLHEAGAARGVDTPLQIDANVPSTSCRGRTVTVLTQ